MNSFYTNVELVGSNILLKEIDSEGVRRHHKVQWQPTLYIKDNSGADSEYTSLYGDRVQPVKPGTVRECRDFVKQYKDVSGFEIFGQLNYILQFANEHYPWDIDLQMSKLSLWSIDIETRVGDNGFPEPKLAECEIVLITLQNVNNGKCYTFGTKPYSGTDTNYVQAKDEYNLLRMFLQFWQRIDVDIITGWNIETFDIPYIANRIKRIMGEDEMKKLSPWGYVDVDTLFVKGNEEVQANIKGISILDYLALYKKFTYTKRESYSLKFISQEELGHTKVDLPGVTFNDNIDNHWDQFVHYNIVDTQLVTELDGKLKLLELAATLAYKAKVNFSDVFSPVKTWDAILHNRLLSRKVVTPQKRGVPSRDIEGAYVKEPRPGKYGWVSSIDAEALYPSFMICMNISPETFKGRIPMNVDQFLTREVDVADMAKSQNICFSPIGAMFGREHIGVIPETIKELLAERKVVKKKMLELESEYEKTKEDSLKSKIAALNAMQMAIKILNNSLYGAAGNDGFRYYHPDIAESITIAGQYVLRRIDNELDATLNKIFKTEEHKYVLYQDTDSIYFDLQPVVDKYLAGKDDAEVTVAIEKLTVDILQREVNKICDQISDELNFIENRLYFKLEAVGSAAIWCGKKKYTIRVHSSEGVTYAKPKMKVMGLEMVRSSTPAFVRSALKEALPVVFDGTEKTTQQYIAKVREDFMQLSVEQQAFPRSANSLADYSDPNTIYKKGCPIQVRGVLLYNDMLRRMNLGSLYTTIGEGDRIRFFYLRLPNPLRENVIAIPADGVLPKEFGLHEYVDSATQFEKSFLAAMQIILTPVGWNAEETSSLEDFFG